MVYSEKLITSFFKILDAINRSMTLHHLQSCENLILNYRKCYGAKPNSNWLIVNGYTELLCYALKNKRQNILKTQV